PNRRERSRKSRTDFSIAIRRERPVERCPGIVQFASEPRHIITAQPGPRTGRDRGKEIPEILGVAPRGVKIFATLGERLQRKGSDRLQQTPSRGGGWIDAFA